MKKELEALLKYLVDHNEEHADEIIELAQKSISLGMDCVYTEMLEGAAELRKSNEHLKSALLMLREE